ncbi:LysR family transcriptional regulator [Ottowia thiooxydans]|uniref:LysR family transcriptional regulator n=1 Tax=Ottowia thiooxydans TaxID=219182 RepID=UPI000407F127|nr:LysR family transcriptional regulator [Ottowia thiooxydans]
MNNRAQQIDRISDVALFVRVAERGNFSAAAMDWHFSPSTVSKAIDRLESRLKVRLFDRTSRAVTLTPSGRAFYGKAQALLDAAESAQSAATQAQEDVRGNLRLHAAPVFGRIELTKVIASFLAKYPEVRIEMFMGLDAPSLAERGLDLLIHSGRLPDSSMVSKPLSTVRWIVCASPSYLARCGMPLQPEDLVQHNCLNFTVKDAWNQWQMSLAQETHEQATMGNFSASDGGALIEMARQGAGIARLGDFHVRPDIDSGALIPLFTNRSFEVHPVLAVYHHRRHLSARIHTFVEYVGEALKERNAAMDAWIEALPGRFSGR